MRTVFFDVDGVLIFGWHARPEKRICWDENIELDLGIERERLSSELFGCTQFLDVITGKMELKHLLEDVLPKLGYSGEPQDFIDYWLRNDAVISHELMEKVKILKNSEQVRLFIATNQVHERARYLMNELGFAEYFEDIFHSARAGALKPDRRYFDYISYVLGIDTEKEEPPILFDDTPEVIEGARAYGWEAYEYLDTESLLENRFIKEILRSG